MTDGLEQINGGNANFRKDRNLKRSISERFSTYQVHLNPTY